MALDRSAVIELLKYPVTIFSILLALIAGKYALGISFGPVAEISPSGVKFTQEAKGEITELASKLNGALVAIEELKKHSPAGDTQSAQAKSTVFQAAQTVSDQTAQLATLSTPLVPDAPKQRGFIWIGDYQSQWNKPMLAPLGTGQPVSVPPEQLGAGTEYLTLGNMVVRDGLPSNDADYFRARKSLGVVPRGTKVRLIRPPTAINREYAVQYWAEIELP
ncbi:hypothetical protein R0381_000682 [Jeongeupia wiesaeckerbachi]|uniref:hypothetical protein n=1 Tax=Jeongeupia wiesaeckerbachi TaxID=3051218 RepID=UPI003D803118